MASKWGNLKMKKEFLILHSIITWIRFHLINPYHKINNKCSNICKNKQNSKMETKSQKLNNLHYNLKIFRKTPTSTLHRIYKINQHRDCLNQCSKMLKTNLQIQIIKLKFHKIHLTFKFKIKMTFLNSNKNPLKKLIEMKD